MCENKPNSKPIQSQYKPNQTQFAEMSQIDVTLVKTRNYNNEQRTMNYYQNKPNTNPIKPNL